MKQFVLFFCISCSSLTVLAQAGSVDETSNEYNFTSSLGSNYLFYGYAQPDSHSEKLICFAAFPGDLENSSNYKLPLGAYHETTSLKDGDRIIYKGRKKGYAEMQFIDASNKATTFYLKSGHVH